MGDALFVVWLTLIWAAITLAIRNQQVHRHGNALADLVYQVGMAEIDAGIHDRWRQRWEVLNAVSYNRQVLLFWRPLDSFYPRCLFASLQQPTPAEAPR